jgi:hypothetical protein
MLPLGSVRPALTGGEYRWGVAETTGLRGRWPKFNKPALSYKPERSGINADMARRLARHFGTSVGVWNSLPAGLRFPSPFAGVHFPDLILLGITPLLRRDPKSSEANGL